jgi:hypothetical protein
MPECEESQKNHARRKNRGQVKSTARGHTDGRHHEQSRSGGEATRVKNRSCPDEADSGDNLRRDSGVVADVLHRERMGENREQGRAKAKKHIRARAGRTVPQLPFEGDDAAENTRQHQPDQGRRYQPASHLLAQQSGDLRPIHACFRNVLNVDRMAEFYHSRLAGHMAYGINRCDYRRSCARATKMAAGA